MGLHDAPGRAWMEIPARASQCKTPQDLVREQLQFWQTAAHDYSEGVQRLTAAFGALAPAGLQCCLGQHDGRAGARLHHASPSQKPAATDQQPKRERRAA